MLGRCFIELAAYMSVQSDQLKERAMSFAIMVLRLVDTLPQTPSGQAIARQLAKSATSVGANYRASCNARSRAEFVAKLGIVVEESDEAEYWLSIIIKAQWLARVDLQPIHAEALELRAIFSKSLGTARTNLKMMKSNDKTTR